MRRPQLLAALLLAGALLPALPATPLLASEGAAAANEAGAALYNAGRPAEALAKFREALAIDPGFEPARGNLAAALATLGQQALQGGSLDEARTLLEEAADRAPGDAKIRFLLGMLFFGRGDLYEARQRVEQALGIDPALSIAHELAGDIHYREGALAPARREWEAALEGAGPRASAVRAKLDRAGREADAEGGFGRDVSRHFTIQYDGPVPAEVARQALRRLEEAYDRLWREFGRPPQHDIPVILYTSATFKDYNPQAPGWASGTYDGKIRIPVGGLAGGEDARLGPILAHELTHAFIRANVPGRLPLWFEEGLAVHFQGATAEESSRLLRSQGVAFTSLDQVSASLAGATPHIAAAYAAASLAVEELVRMDGSWLPRKILELVAEGRPFEEAFRSAAWMPLDEFEQRWARLQR
jgi:tetratricopeptide (TPR) repeat protein